MKLKTCLSLILTIVILLNCFLLLFNLFGCQWLMPEEEVPDASNSQGSVDPDVPQEPTDEADDTIQLDSELITALSEYLKNYYISYEIPSLTFDQKIDKCKKERTPIFVSFGDECYYAVAYYNEPHVNAGKFCCYDKYTWIGFKNAESISEILNGEKIVASFQINCAETCYNIKTDDKNYVVGHFTLYQPEFVDGKAVSPDVSFKNSFIFLTTSEEKLIYYSSKSALHEVYSFDCIEINDCYFAKQMVNAEKGDGIYYEIDLHNCFGAYYDDLIESVILGKYSEKNLDHTINYALINIEDLAEIIKGDN